MRSKLFAPQFTARIGLILLLLAPLAYLGAFTMFARSSALLQVRLQIDRDEAVARARQFAATKEPDVTNWSGYLKGEHFDDRYLYYRSLPNQDLTAVRAFAPEWLIRVVLIKPDQKENVEVWQTPNGQIIGYQRRFVNDAALPEVPEAEARQLAEATMRQRAEARNLTPLPTPNYNEERSGENVTRTYTWEWQQAPWANLQNKTLIAVRGKQVIAEKIESKVDENFARETLKIGTTHIIVIVSIYILLSLIVVLFGIFRFAERVRQKEISFARIAILGGAVTVIYGGFILLTDASIYDSATSLRLDGATWLNRLFAVIFWGLVGVFLGFAYGSGEGDIRELYPGKMTSLDALMRGRIFSRNVAQAVIHGLAISGWLFLATTGFVFIFARQYYAGWRLFQPEVFLAKFGWLLALLSWSAEGLVTAIFVIMLPLPLLHRRVKNKRLILPLIFLLAIIADAIYSIPQINPWYLGIAPTICAAAILLFVFFRFDLLTAIIGLSGNSLLLFAVLFLAQPAPSLHRAGIIIAAVTLAGISCATYFYFKGHLYAEAQVRPLYAKHLAERLSLQAEVSAAREAQIRLLPDKIPAVERLSLAAACLPAHEVGGDFYDLFELEPGKLGIFLAEGGGQGLASALTIAFAKGYLMPRLRSQAFTDNSPAEIVRSLKSQLTRTMEHEHELGFLYAIVDTSDNTFRYASTGSAPQIRINAQPATKSERQGDVSELKFNINDEEYFTIREGIYFLEAGDTIALLTDRLAQLIQSSPNTHTHPFLPALSHAPHLQMAMQSALKETARQQSALDDDLTAVMVRLEPSGGTTE